MDFKIEILERIFQDRTFQIGKMDKLTDEEQMRSGMMLETVTEVFLGMVMPAFKLVRGEMAEQPREKQCEAFHAKVRETTKGKLETKWSLSHDFVTRYIQP